MLARLALIVLATLFAGAATSAPQTHELISCGSHAVQIECYGSDINTPVVTARRIHDLYAAGWRLISVEVQGNGVTYWLERPITPEQ